MFCENCGVNAATTHIKKTVNGVTKEYFLCQECANKLGLSSFNFFDNNYFDLFFKEPSVAKKKTCEGCKSTYEDILKSGKMGCTKCYETFKEELTPSLMKMQKSIEHIGNRPKQQVEIVDEVKNLEDELKQAILNEEYEKAAELRDIIRAKRGESNG